MKMFSILGNELKCSFEEQTDKFKYGDILERAEVVCFAITYPVRCAIRVMEFTIKSMIFSAGLVLTLGAVFFPRPLADFFSQAAAANAHEWVSLIHVWFLLNVIATVGVAAFLGIKMPSTKPRWSRISGGASSVK